MCFGNQLNLACFYLLHNSWIGSVFYNKITPPVIILLKTAFFKKNLQVKHLRTLLMTRESLPAMQNKWRYSAGEWHDFLAL